VDQSDDGDLVLLRTGGQHEHTYDGQQFSHIAFDVRLNLSAIAVQRPLKGLHGLIALANSVAAAAAEVAVGNFQFVFSLSEFLKRRLDMRMTFTAVPVLGRGRAGQENDSHDRHRDPRQQAEKTFHWGTSFLQ
jgi:hypothetical protein